MCALCALCTCVCGSTPTAASPPNSTYKLPSRVCMGDFHTLFHDTPHLPSTADGAATERTGTTRVGCANEHEQQHVQQHLNCVHKKELTTKAALYIIDVTEKYHALPNTRTPRLRMWIELPRVHNTKCQVTYALKNHNSNCFAFNMLIVFQPPRSHTHTHAHTPLPNRQT